MDDYRCVASTLGGFIQQLAVCYVDRGYWYYVKKSIPEHKDPELIDQKIISTYGIALSKFQRARRKKAGAASLQYIRYQRNFVILATPGIHHFFEEQGDNIRYVPEYPIYFDDYSIGIKNDRLRVALSRNTYRNLRSYFLNLALPRSKPALEKEFRLLPYEPYSPVYRQLTAIVKTVNRRRHRAGLSSLSIRCIRRKRRIYRPFEEQSAEHGSGGIRKTQLLT